MRLAWNSPAAPQDPMRYNRPFEPDSDSRPAGQQIAPQLLMAEHFGVSCQVACATIDERGFDPC